MKPLKTQHLTAFNTLPPGANKTRAERHHDHLALRALVRRRPASLSASALVMANTLGLIAASAC